jgi:hypothetical protein
MKYFFLSDGWSVGRVWEFGGLWNENINRRKPDLQRLDIHFWENGEKLWLYRVEESVIMVEVYPVTNVTEPIGEVVLKRLMNAEQAIDRLNNSTGS